MNNKNSGAQDKNDLIKSGKVLSVTDKIYTTL